MPQARRNYDVPQVDEQWINDHCTHPAVAMAIHAIADSKRSPHDIWASPTSAEEDHIRMALTEYVYEGDFEWEPRGFKWGIDKIKIANPEATR